MVEIYDNSAEQKERKAMTETKKFQRVAIPETTRKFYFNFSRLTFAAGTKACFLDEYYYEMENEAWMQDGELMVALKDLQTVCSPDMVTEQSGDELCLSLRGGSAKVKPIVKDGTDYVPAASLIREMLGWYVQKFDSVALEDFVTVNSQPEKLTVQEGKGMQLVIKGKDHGDVCGTYWFEEGKKLLPYRAYVPTRYDGNAPMPMVILTHGGSSPQSIEFARAGHGFQREAEKRGYLLFGIDGYLVSSFYGSILPSSSTIGEFDLDKVDRENPKNLSPEVIALRKESERACQEQIRFALHKYNVDPKRIYMMGNSMGGLGTYHLASINPGMFKALAPCGGSVNPDFFPIETLKGIPICIFAGSEDENGLEPLQTAARMMKERGLDHTIYVTGGGWHSAGYLEALPEIFDFFDANS